MTVEKRLLQTMDMILVKKKRIALNKKREKTPSSGGIWGMITSVTTKTGTESMYNLNTYLETFVVMIYLINKKYIRCITTKTRNRST